MERKLLLDLEGVEETLKSRANIKKKLKKRKTTTLHQRGPHVDAHSCSCKAAVDELK